MPAQQQQQHLDHLTKIKNIYPRLQASFDIWLMIIAFSPPLLFSCKQMRAREREKENRHCFSSFFLCVSSAMISFVFVVSRESMKR